jgi:hypothetical protein
LSPTFWLDGLIPARISRFLPQRTKHKGDEQNWSWSKELEQRAGAKSLSQNTNSTLYTLFIIIIIIYHHPTPPTTTYHHLPPPPTTYHHLPPMLNIIEK